MQINIKKSENFEKNGISEHRNHGIPKEESSGKWKKKSIFYAKYLHI